MLNIGALVVRINIIVAALKKFIWDKTPANFLVVCIVIPLTVTAFYAWAGITVPWWSASQWLMRLCSVSISCGRHCRKLKVK